MSPRLKRLSGSEVVSILQSFGFYVHSQRGSHVKLRNIGVTGEKQTLTIPRHDELDAVRQATHYIPETELRPCFYTD